MELPFLEMGKILRGSLNLTLGPRKSPGSHTECPEIPCSPPPLTWAFVIFEGPLLPCYKSFCLVLAHNLLRSGNYVQSFKVYKIDECRTWLHLQVRYSVKLRSLKQMSPLSPMYCSPRVLIWEGLRERTAAGFPLLMALPILGYSAALALDACAHD